MRFGTEFHAFMEGVSWLDEATPEFPEGPVGQAVAALLAAPGVSGYFRREGRRIRLMREQPVLAVSKGDYLTGVIDRLHVHESEDGQVTRVEVLDYKTDAIERIEELSDRYGGQMEAYRDSLRKIFPGVPVSCILLSSRLASAIVL